MKRILNIAVTSRLAAVLWLTVWGMFGNFVEARSVVRATSLAASLSVNSYAPAQQVDGPTPTPDPTLTPTPTVAATATATTVPTNTRPIQCTTRTRLDGTPLPRAWIFVMNFRSRSDGCMIFYDRGVADRILKFNPLIDACKTIGDVRFFAGKAFFWGGYIACDINIRDAVNAIAPPASQITETAVITGFYMLGRGVISPTTPVSPFSESLIIGYDPIEPGYARVSVGMVVTSTTPNQALMVARFNNNVHTHGGCNFAFNDLTHQQIWALTRPNNGAKLWLGGTQVCDISPRPLIELRQDGGTFYIGGHPNGQRFYGMLEEVVVDPYDGGRPPAEISDDNPEIDPVFLPMLMR